MTVQPKTLGSGLRGLLIACIVGLCMTTYGFSGMSATGDGDYSVFVVMANIGLVQVPIVETFMASTRARHQITRKERFWVLARVTTTTLGNMFGILTLKHIPLGDAAALTNLSIAFTMIKGRIFLKEECKLLEIFTLVLTLGGSMLVAQPEILFYPGSAEAKTLHDRLFGLLFGVATALSYSSTNIIHYKGTRHMPAGTICFYQVMITAVGYSIITLIMGHSPIIYHVNNRAFVLLTALSTIAAQVASVIAFKYNTAGLTILVMYAAYMVFGFLFQLILGVIPNYWSIAGASCISLGLIVNMIDTAKLGRTPVTKEEEEDLPEIVL